MSYFPIVNDIIEVTVQCWSPILTQLGENTLHYVVTSVTTGGATTSEIAVAMDTQFSAALKGLLSTSAQYEQVLVSKIFPLPRVVQQASSVGAGVGTGGAGLLPGQLSLVVSKYTNLAGPSFRGRVFVPFPYTAACTATGTALAAYVTQCSTYAGRIAANVTVTGAGGNTVLTPCVWNRVDHVPTILSSVVAQKIFGTQRRRGDYGRSNPSPL